jgi:hypothetical protein
VSIVKANTYQDATGGSNAVFSGVASPPNGMGFRSRIINGGMAVDQRNAGAAQTITAAAALAYTVDRWYAYSTGANVTGQRVAGAGANQYRYQFTGAASVTKIGFVQRIEALNSYDLNNISATLSVDLANSVLTTVTWVASYANTTDTFGSLASPTVTQIATGTFTVNSTVTGYSTTISIPSAATTGLQIEFSVGAQTSGTWTIGNVQLEAGTVASPFERRDYGRELMMCQRYYQVGDIHLLAAGTNSGDGTVSLPVQMRASPTYTYTDSAGTADRYTDSSGNGLTFAVNANNVNAYRFRAQVALARTASWWEFNYRLSVEL